MKKISIKTGNIIRSMLAGAISLLGFTACDDPENPDDGGTICMYGTPTGCYEIKGSVTTATGEPIENARVILRHINGRNVNTYYGDTVLTGSKGHYEMKTGGWPDENIRVVCQPQDNALEADSVNLKVTFKGEKGPWMQGTASETVNFKLKNKK